MRSLLALVALLALATCGTATRTEVQRSHAREVRCDRRYVHAERLDAERWRSLGCGFAAEWTCREGDCALSDLRAHGTGAP